MTWRPIESAPMDGSFFLGYCRGSIYIYNRCVITGKRWHIQFSTRVMINKDNQPTHWQPLPEPPKNA